MMVQSMVFCYSVEKKEYSIVLTIVVLLFMMWWVSLFFALFWSMVQERQKCVGSIWILLCYVSSLSKGSNDVMAQVLTVFFLQHSGWALRWRLLMTLLFVVVEQRLMGTKEQHTFFKDFVTAGERHTFVVCWFPKC